jgi:hypothetical protein
MNIALLQGSLAVADHPGLDSTDPRFDDIVTLTQAGKHDEAAQQCQAIIAEGVFDVRLICYFLYGHFLEHGLASLQAINLCLCNVIEDNWAAIGPVTNREKNLAKSLDWLLRQVIKKCKYEESKSSPDWRNWQATVSEDVVEAIVQSGKQLRGCLLARMDDKAAPVIDQWSKMEQWLRLFLQVLPVQAVVPIEDESVPALEETEDNASLALALPSPAVKQTAKTAKKDTMEIELSHPLQQLIKKLAGFDRMVSEQKFDRAVLLADDINQLCQDFDPKLYFPKLFETFVRQQAIHLEELMAYTDHRGTQEWACMQEWLKVDPDSFIDYP